MLLGGCKSPVRLDCGVPERRAGVEARKLGAMLRRALSTALLAQPQALPVWTATCM